MNILAVGAHPDDVEINCGGTLSKYAARGDKVFIATATNGNIGSAIWDKEKTAEIRKAEAAKSASLIGAEYLCLDFDDEYLPYTHEARDKFINLIRYCKPDVILTHYPYRDYLTDHEFTGKMVNDVIVLIPVAKIQTKHPPCAIQPEVYYFEPFLGLNFNPTDYVDISGYYETKKRMLFCHDSQKQWLSDNLQSCDASEKAFENQIRITAEFRGMQCGVQYAEAFVRCTDAYRLKPGCSLP